MQTRQKIATLALIPLFLGAAGLTLATAPSGQSAGQSEDSQRAIPQPGQIAMRATTSPSCGCCGAWVDLARAEGYHVTVAFTDDLVAAKDEAGVPDALWSCHTVEVEGYTIEGHVPFTAIRRLLDERPSIDGIAVPGMPAGSPGMGNDPRAVYDVIAHGGDAGSGQVFYRAGASGS